MVSSKGRLDRLIATAVVSVVIVVAVVTEVAEGAATVQGNIMLSLMRRWLAELLRRLGCLARLWRW